jgi:O-antigen ligase
MEVTRPLLRKWRRILLNSFLHKLLLLLVILAPLPLGSNREWSWTLCAVIVAFITLGWVLLSLFRPQQVSASLKPPVIVLFLATISWAWIQTVAWVPAEWKHPLWGMGAEIIGQVLPGSISLSTEDSFIALMRLLCYGLVFFLAFQFGRNRDMALATLKWLAFAGLAYSIYGLIIFWGDFGTLFWFYDESFKGDVRGTFVNRNSFATYAGLALLCAIAVFNQQVTGRRSAAYSVPRSGGLQIERFILQVWKPLTAILLMTTALILTHSRGGFFSTLAGGLVLLFLLNKRQQGQSAMSKAALGGAVLVAVAAFVLTSEVLLQRIDRITADGNGRLEVYAMTTEAIGDNPLLGFGYGTFSDSFRLYRDDRLGAHFDKTHNTYLENIFELGWPAAGILFLCIGCLMLVCIRGVRERGRDWVYPATGVAATVLVAIHSFFDFSLQMPAIAITYACILGIACAQSYSSRPK